MSTTATPTLFSSSTTTRCLRPSALNSLNTRGRDVSCKQIPPLSTPSVLIKVISPRSDPVFDCITHLWYSVRRWVHELGQVHHALPLVLGDVDALDRGKAGIGVPEVLQLELPLRQPGPRQLHKHLWRQRPTQSTSQEPQRLFVLYKKCHNCRCYLVLEKNDELRAENQAAELGWLEDRTSARHITSKQIQKRKPGAAVRYLVTTRNLHHHWETVVIGGRVAEGVHDGSHLLNSVQTCHWRTHHFPGHTVSDKDEILHHIR